MKKFLVFISATLLSVAVNAQIAYENAKLTDNLYVGVSAGVTTPLSFNSVFPLNATVGVKVGKEITPVFGVNVEGMTWLGSQGVADVFKHFDVKNVHNVFRATNVGVNSTVNWSNLIWGYKGSPRALELGSVVGLGWAHVFIPNRKNDYDALSAKTGINLAWNFSKNRAHSLYVEPSVIWSLNKYGYSPIEMNKNYAHLSLQVGYTYHFKTSNGTHSFKSYDVGAMNAEINALRAQLAKKPTEIVKEVKVEVIKEVPVETVIENTVAVDRTYTVHFTKGSYELSNNAKNILNSVPTNVSVSVEATASPEGSEGFNNTLSVRRAEVVSSYLKRRGVRVVSANGLGVTGDDSQRIARVLVH